MWYRIKISNVLLCLLLLLFFSFSFFHSVFFLSLFFRSLSHYQYFQLQPYIPIYAIEPAFIFLLLLTFNLCVTLGSLVILCLEQDATTTDKNNNSYNNRYSEGGREWESGKKIYRISNVSETQYFFRSIESTS